MRVADFVRRLVGNGRELEADSFHRPRLRDALMLRVNREDVPPVAEAAHLRALHREDPRARQLGERPAAQRGAQLARGRAVRVLALLVDGEPRVLHLLDPRRLHALAGAAQLERHDVRLHVRQQEADVGEIRRGPRVLPRLGAGHVHRRLEQHAEQAIGAAPRPLARLAAARGRQLLRRVGTRRRRHARRRHARRLPRPLLLRLVRLLVGVLLAALLRLLLPPPLLGEREVLRRVGVDVLDHVLPRRRVVLPHEPLLPHVVRRPVHFDQPADDGVPHAAGHSARPHLPLVLRAALLRARGRVGSPRRPSPPRRAFLQLARPAEAAVAQPAHAQRVAAALPLRPLAAGDAPVGGVRVGEARALVVGAGAGVGQLTAAVDAREGQVAVGLSGFVVVLALILEVPVHHRLAIGAFHELQHRPSRVQLLVVVHADDPVAALGVDDRPEAAVRVAGAHVAHFRADGIPAPLHPPRPRPRQHVEPSRHLEAVVLLFPAFVVVVVLTLLLAALVVGPHRLTGSTELGEQRRGRLRGGRRVFSGVRYRRGAEHHAGYGIGVRFLRAWR
mmetsp:Transcript_8865/g.21913  ORF Transcript_8865/g.21913 Transcript_8865/m.21913 type:complete len:560 (-) Transcript_8865:78-1757(-)